MLKMRINLDNAENIIKAMKRRADQDEQGRPLCACKPQSTSDKDVCPCFDMVLNEKCCCGLFVLKEDNKQ
jgi:ferredoxin-thioredoxin reductase catalytic subunit